MPKKRKGDDDDFFASLASSSAAEPIAGGDAAVAEEPEEPRLVGKVKTKTKKQSSGEASLEKVTQESAKQSNADLDSDEEASSQAVSGISKISSKKKKKGRVDDDEAEAPKETNILMGGKKKKNAKGKRGAYTDFDDAPEAAEETPPPTIVTRKEKKTKAKAKSKSRNENESESDDPLALVNKLAALSDSDKDEESEEAHDGRNEAQNSVNVSDSVIPADEALLNSDRMTEAVHNYSSAGFVTPEVVAATDSRTIKSKARLSKAERKKVKGGSSGSEVPTLIAPTVVEVVVETLPTSLVPSSAAAEQDIEQQAENVVTNVDSVAVDTIVVDDFSADASVPAITEAAAVPEQNTIAAPEKPKKKSKLELKLEAAKKAREEAEARKKEECPPKDDISLKALSDMSKLSIENVMTVSGAKQSGVKEAKDGTLVSTMFGDDVFSEHVVHKKDIKYDAAALKASAEGAQFAVSQSAVNPNDPQWQNALDISIANFSISAHNKELFYNAELNIAHGRRYGLVGPNGAGKSTLLKMISSGELQVPPRVDYLYVEQEVLADGTRAVDAVLKADKERWELLQEEKDLLSALELKADEEKDVRLGEVHARLDAIGASAAEGRARRILFGLGFDAEMQVRPTQFFSGGWRMRIALARALFIEPTLLMLDEPTNHLDLNAVIWLDDYLQKWKKTVLIVSHDQDFLNSVCDEIIHLQEKKLYYYKGNYDSFKEQETIVKKQRQKEWERQERKLRELKSKGSSKAGAEKSMIKSKAREPGARAARKADAANLTSGIESAESKVELLKRPKDYTVQFSFPEVVHVTPPILEVHDVTFQYGPCLPILFKNLNFGLDMDSRVCIVGPNGSGKSTILKLITGEINPEIGDIRRNPRLRVGVYNQHFMDRLPMDEDAVTYIRRMFNDETYQSARNILGRYGLEGHAHTIPIRDLSGGQKARVVFVELSLMSPHLLFLDEPTNNLDIESIDALCEALQEYNGGVILVSHDARLIETTSCQLWVVEDQNVTPWESGFAGYRAHLLRKLEEQMSIIIAGSGERPV